MTPPIHMGLAQHPIKTGRGRGLSQQKEGRKAYLKKKIVESSTTHQLKEESQRKVGEEKAQSND